MNPVKWLSIIIGCVMICLTACVEKEDSSRESSRDLNNPASTFLYNAVPEGAHAEISVEYSTAINTFSVNLLKTVYGASAYEGTNVILSPFSVSRNLSVIAEGTTGQSRQELLDALGGLAVLDDARAALAELLYSDNSIVFQCADAVWIDSTKYSLVQTFSDTVRYKYGVQTAGLDFGDASGAAETINEWIDENTNHKITEMIGPDIFTGITAAVVTNAIYFEADWASPFDVTRTQAHEFEGPDGTVMVDMMESDYLHDTRKTDLYENARLYYGTNSADYFYLDIYMPKTMSVHQFLQDSCLAILSRDDLDLISQGSVKLPKFFFTTRCDLVPMLKNMGVNRIFDPAAGEITGMVQSKSGADNPMFIEKVIHEAGIKTDEEGTEAYAVTVSTIGATSAGPISPDVVFDHPFVYFIRAGQNGLVIFAGVVNDPG